MKTIRSCAFESLENRQHFSFGTTDLTFGLAGKVASPVIGTSGTAEESQTLASGKLLVAGDGGIARLLSDGSADTTFGVAGKTPFAALDFIDFATDASNRIYTLGKGLAGTVISRYTADGALDVTFGLLGNAVVTTNANFVPAAIDVQTDGKVVVAGLTKTDAGQGARATLLRLKSTGAGDGTFGTGGQVQFHFTTPDATKPITIDAIADLSVLPGGEIVVAGAGVNFSPATSSVAVSYGDAVVAATKFSSTGAVVSGFGTGGKITAIFDEAGPTRPAVASVQALIPDTGLTFVAADTEAGNAAVIKFTAAGTLDFVTTVTDPRVGSVRDLALLNDGRLAVVSAGTALAGLALTPVSAVGNEGYTVFSSDSDATTEDLDYDPVSASVSVSGDGKLVVSANSSLASAGHTLLQKFQVGSDSDARPDSLPDEQLIDFKLDHAGGLHAAYMNLTNNMLEYRYRAPNGIWDAEVTVDTGAYSGTYVSIDVKSDNTPVIAYFQGLTGDLKIATSTDRAAFTLMTAESRGSTGLYCSVLVDAADRPNVSYFNKTHGDLKFGVLTAPNVFSSQTIDEVGNVGRSSVLRKSSATGLLGIAYTDDTNLTLKYAGQRTGGWDIKTAAPTTGGASFLSMDFGAFGAPTISYYDAYNADLKIAYIDAASPAFQTRTLMTAGATGLYSNVFYTSYTASPTVWSWNRTTNRATALRNSLPATKVPLPVKSVAGGRYLNVKFDAATGQTIAAYLDPSTNMLTLRNI